MKRSYRRARSNPSFLGAFPPIKSIALVGAGYLVPPMVQVQLNKFLPVEWQTGTMSYVVRGASVLLPGIAIRKFMSTEAGNLFLLGGLAKLAVDLLTSSGVLAQFGLAGSPAQPFLGGMGYYPGMAGRRSMMTGLGKYPSLSSGGPVNLQSPAMIQGIPDRLNPNTRF